MIYGTVVKQILDKLKAPVIVGVFALALPLSSCGGGGGSAAPVSVSTIDILPNAYNIADLSNLVSGAVFTTNTITVSGINTPVTITTNLGTLVINGINTGVNSSTINNGDTVAITGTASPLSATALNGQIRIGSLTDIFSVTTQALVDTTPNPFNFTNIVNAVPNGSFTSNTITVAGVSTQVTATTTLGILVVNGINTGVSSTVVNNGDTIAITGTAAASNATTLNGTVTIGTLSDPFAVTTAAVINTAPTATNVTLDMLSQASITYNLDPNIADEQTPDSGLQVNVIAAPANGTVTLDTVNLHNFTYTPNTGFNGSDSFTYAVVDPAALQSAVRTVTLNNTVAPDTTPPVLSSTTQTFTTIVGTPLTLQTVTANDAVDGVVTVVQGGTTPNFNAIGTYAVIYTATDAAGNASTITHTYQVNAVPDTTPPVSATSIAINGGATITNNQTLSLNITHPLPSDVAKWFVSEVAAAPLPGNAGWATVKPTSYTLANTTNGLRTIYVYVQDAAGNVQAVGTSNSITFDNVAPTTMSFSGVTPDTKNTQYNSLAMTLNDSIIGGSITSLTSSNGGTLSTPTIDGTGKVIFNFLTPNTAGTTLTLTGVDAAGNAFITTLNVTLPLAVNTAPTIGTPSSTGNLGFGGLTNISVPITDDNLALVTWTLSYTPPAGSGFTGTFSTTTGTGSTLNGITFSPIAASNGWTIKATIVDSGAGTTNVVTIYAN